MSTADQAREPDCPPPPGAESPGRGKRILWLLKIALSVAALAFCFYQVDIATLLELARHADLALLAVIPLLVIVQTCVGAVRFKVLADPLLPLQLAEHIRQYFVAGYFNLLLPSSIGGDAVRVFLLGRKGASRSKAAIYIFSERLMGLYSLIGVSFMAALAITVSNQTQTYIYALLVFTLTSFAGIFVLLRITRHWRQYHVCQFRSAAHELWLHKRRLFLALGISLVYQCLTISFTLVVAAAIGIDIAWLYIFALVPLVWLVTFLPISLGGVGVREISFIGLFTEVGLGAEQAILLSLGTYAAMVIGGLMGGIWTTRDMLKAARAEAG